MDNNPFYSALLSRDVISQAPEWPFAQGLDSSRWDCLLTHTSHGVVHGPLVGKENPGPQCTSSMSGDGHPVPYSGLEVLTSCQPHRQNHSTLVPESDQSYEIPVYNAQQGSLTQFMNTGPLHDHWTMRDHTVGALDSDCQEGNGDLSKYTGLPLVPWIAAQAMTKSHRSGSCVQQGSAAQYAPVDDHGTTPPTMKPPSARRPLKHTVRRPCGWVKEDGTKCNTYITYDCARHLATAHGIKRQGRHLKVLCCWCSPPEPFRRSGMLRHVREVHLKCPRSSTRARPN